MCTSNEESENPAESPEAKEKQYLARIAKLEKLVDIQEIQKNRLKLLNEGLRQTVKELLSRP